MTRSILRTAAALFLGCVSLAGEAAAQCEFAELGAADAQAQAAFGRALATDAGRALVGAPQHGSHGAAYLFDLASGAAGATLGASDAAVNDSFGASVALGAGLAVVGAPLDDDHGPDSGAAYVFDAASGQELLKLTAPDGAGGDLFGIALAVGDGVIAVGADGDDDGASNAGSIYLFDLASGALLAKLGAQDASVDARLGGSLAIAGGKLVAGAWNKTVAGLTSRGAAYVFDLASGAQLFALLASDGAAYDYFGTSVAAGGGLALVGAPRTDDLGPNSGSAYVFDLASGAELWSLVPPTGGAGDFCGLSVALDGTLAVLGAPFFDGPASNTGIAHVFRVTTGQHLFDLDVPSGADQDQAGSAVGVLGPRVLLGAPLRSLRADEAGAAHLFVLADGDCNHNGIPDGCDLAAGTSVDADLDGIPDECRSDLPIWRRSSVDQRWYTLVPDDHWVGHEVQARAFGGHLATVAGAAEEAWLRASFPNRALHLGYNDAAQEGTFVWIAGDPPGYENWALGQPDDEPGTFGADFAVLDPLTGAWRDEPDQSPALGLVEVVSDDCDGNGLPDVFEIVALLADDWNGDGVLDRCVPANFCSANPNSSGQAARMDPEGSPFVADNAFVLVARDLPANRLGYFLGSRESGFVPNFGGSSGNLCLAGTILRFSTPPTGEVGSSGPQGELVFQPDLGSFPGGAVVAVGETWYFQAWFRDVTASGAPTSNTSDGIEVLFR